MNARASAGVRTPAAHTRFEDLLGLVSGCALVALAVLMLREAGLVTGSTAGLAVLVHHRTGWPLAALLFAVNLPFYAFGWRALGAAFALKTFAAVSLLSALVALLPNAIRFAALDAGVAALLAGLLAGCGILILIRHGASLGGVGILAIYLQKTRGWRAGTVQMGFDAAVLATAFGVLAPLHVLLSVGGAAVLNLVIGVNHRADRYYAG
jgi:uncharacterized membrane-anchored protein YitT (DUF2179 family)